METGTKKVYCGGIAVRGIYHYSRHRTVTQEECGWGQVIFEEKTQSTPQTRIQTKLSYQEG